MQLTDFVDFPMLDHVNATCGGILVVVTYLFGEHWVLFVALLALNVADWVTGTIKARILKKESSSAGLFGIVKKFLYWIMIALAFGVSPILNEIGKVAGTDVSPFSPIIGWLILSMLLVNEFRSICENLVEIGVPVPKILTKGLKVVSDKIEEKSDAILDLIDGDDDGKEKKETTAEPPLAKPFKMKTQNPVLERESPPIDRDVVTLRIQTVRDD